MTAALSDTAAYTIKVPRDRWERFRERRLREGVARGGQLSVNESINSLIEAYCAGLLAQDAPRRPNAKDPLSRPCRQKFKPPTVAEAQEYATRAGLGLVKPKEFVTYWDSVGWIRGGKQMRNWKAAMQNRQQQLEGR